MDVYLCEKEEQAKDLAKAAGPYKECRGFIQVGANMRVTYASGHLLELYKPQDYNPNHEKWKIQDLPINPEEWKKKTTRRTKGQFNIVKEQLEKYATRIFIATDMDREGESIAQEILDLCKVSVPIQRIKTTSLDEDSLREALKNPMDIPDINYSANSAEARRRADWLVGMNLTRMYSLLGQQFGYEGTFHVGRVSAPTINLVAKRCDQILSHEAQAYHTLKVTVLANGNEFIAKWRPELDICDEKKRCIGRAKRDSVAQSCLKQVATVLSYESKIRKERAPLPFDLNTLQQLACEKWNYTAKEVLEALQKLYITHKAITYPRVENRFLPSGFINKSEDILEAISQSGVTGKQIASGTLLSYIPVARVFNDEKVDPAHHAIIPTRKIIKEEKLSKIEGQLYLLICRFFAAQFYPSREFDQSEVEIEYDNQIFTASARNVLKTGFMAVLGSSLAEIDDSNNSTPINEHPIPHLCYEDTVRIIEIKPEDHKTKPPKHFTESALISAMKRIGNYEEDESLRKELNNKAGIGTPATRAEVIQQACERGYLLREPHKKRITITDKGRDLIAILPEQICSPGTTAIWEMRMEKIASGQLSPEDFTVEVSEWVESIVGQTLAAIQ